MKLAVLILFQVFGAALLWSCFSRLTFTSKRNTKRAVRWTFTALAVVAAVCLAAPWFADYQPDAMATALLGISALTQLVTAHYWRAGVPRQFQKEPAP